MAASGCLKKFVAETLPKLPTGGAARFREMLQKDAGVQKVLQVYAEKLQAWHAKLVAAAGDGGGMYAQWCSELQANKCLEKNSIALQPAGSLTASLTPLQACPSPARRPSTTTTSSSSTTASASPSFTIAFITPHRPRPRRRASPFSTRTRPRPSPSARPPRRCPR